MARIRSIKPEFWEDEKLADIPIQARLLFIGCWNFADDFGVLPDSIKWIKAKIFPYDSLREHDVKQWCDALVKNRMLVPFSHKDKGYYIIRRFRSHQIIDKRYEKSLLPVEIVNQFHEEHEDTTERPQCEHIVNTSPDMEVERIGKEKDMDIAGDKSPQHPPEVFEKFKSFQQWTHDHAPNVSKMKEPITIDQFVKLKEKFSSEKICELLQKMHNWKPLLKKNNSAYLTLINWSKNGFNTEEPTKGKTVSNHREEDGRRILEESFS